MPADATDFVEPVRRHLRQPRLQRLLVEELLDSCRSGSGGMVAWAAAAGGAGVTSRKSVGSGASSPARGRLHDEQPPVQALASAVLDRGREDVEQGRLVAVEVEEDRAPDAGASATRSEDVLPDDLEQRMPRRDPFQRRVRVAARSCRRRPAVLAAQPTEPRLRASPIGSSVRGTLPMR